MTPEEGQGKTTLMSGEDEGAPDDNKPGDNGAGEGERPFGKFETSEALLEGYTQLEAFQGSSVRIPGEDATPEDIEKFNAKMRPETAEGYALAAPEGLPEGMTYDTGFAGKFAEVAHTQGLSARQVAGLHEWWNGAQIEAYNSSMVEADAAEKALKAELGVEYNPTIAMAKRVINGIQDPDVKAVFQGSALGNSPGMIKFLADYGRKTGEKTTVVGDGVPSGGESKEVIQAKIDAVYKDEKHAYFGRDGDEGKKEAAADMRKWRQQIAAMDEAANKETPTT